jgi:hydrogenase maturation protease
VRELLEMAAVLGKLPARVQLVGIEIASTAPGRGLSPEVERAVERAVAGVVAMLVGKMKSGKDY